MYKLILVAGLIVLALTNLALFSSSSPVLNGYPNRKQALLEF